MPGLSRIGSTGGRDRYCFLSCFGVLGAMAGAEVSGGRGEGQRERALRLRARGATLGAEGTRGSGRTEGEPSRLRRRGPAAREELDEPDLAVGVGRERQRRELRVAVDLEHLLLSAP